MKRFVKILLIFVLLAVSATCFSACSLTEGPKTLITVEFRCDCDECSLCEGQVLSRTQQVTDPADIKVPTYTRKGYTLSGWSVNLSSIYADTIVNPVWIANVYEIRFDATGGTFANGNTTYGELFTVIYGNTVSAQRSLPQPSKEGFQFIGWYLGTTLITEDLVWTLEHDVTLVAKYKDKNIKYAITFDTDGGSLISPDNSLLYQMVKDPKEIIVPAVVKNGYIFVEWRAESGVKIKDCWETETFVAVWRKPYFVVEFDLSCTPFKWQTLAWSTVNGKTQIPNVEVEKGTSMGEMLCDFEPVEKDKLKAMYWTVKGYNRVRIYKDTILDESYDKYLVDGKLILQAQLANNSWT